MGMDVYGKKPNGKTGEYFRNSCWGWRPLWRYVLKVAPWVGEKVIHGQSNDGDGLDGPDSIALAKILRAEISTGRCGEFAMRYEAAHAALADEPCPYCNATGARLDSIGVANGFHSRRIDKPGHPRYGQEGWCNGYDGVGKVRPIETSYPFEVENVQNFAAFLEKCGGFEIH